MPEKTGDAAELAFGSEEIIVYTDGGCSGNPGPGGWGCVILADGTQYTASGGEPVTTNNRMELSAAIAALSAIDQNESWKQRPIRVHIDSQYVKNGITSWIRSWKKNGWRNSEKQPVKNRDLWELLDALNGRLSVSWNWVKGHAGVTYNELCDELATKEVKKYSK
nr:ribonuclease HI [Treponema brennaborense]